ncbi:hypothetical protein [Pararhizobium sp.]|uniref:hypothetical protein n=1 Tax=Pararhizobium sp. TaxID=1977563 RepID=UPI002727C683|nr:hypothetical protein [Pararhizobium sp.]MDO9416991.1 hypothetical protein [Pararhizobium sp.]
MSEKHLPEIVAYAASSRPNALWSAAQFNSALPKNRADCDTPLVALSSFDALAAERDQLVARAEQAEAIAQHYFEALQAVQTIASQARRHRGNIGKEATFLEVIEDRAKSALSEANALMEK